MPLLGGLHDREAAAVVPEGGWVLDTVALSENPTAVDYTVIGPKREWIVRLNFGYHPRGTIPAREYYGLFAEMCSRYVAASKGCHRWIIGNEPNLSIERPNGQPILPYDYASCYDLCRQAIRSVPGHENDKVLVAASGPWNAETRYHANPDGDWIKYFVDVISSIGVGIDGYSIHAYTHNYDANLVYSEAKMNAPFQNRHYEFRTYRDYIDAIPANVADKEIHITESNGNGVWQSVGLIPAMLNEISQWNARSTRPVHSVIFYRYACHDQYCMQDKSNVMDEFQMAMRKTYNVPGSNKLFVPISNNQSAPTPPQELKWDSDLDKRGVKLTSAAVPDGQTYFAVAEGDYINEQESQGRHHIYVDVVDADGKRIIGQKIKVFWNGGSVMLITEAKPGERAAASFPMYASGYAYGVVVDGEQSDSVTGMGLGSIEHPHMGIHVSYFLKFKKSIKKSTVKPVEPPFVTQPLSETINIDVLQKQLIHPVSDPTYRVVSQYFGGNESYYKQFVVDGVPLKGHNGIDFATPEGTKIVCVDKGRVVEVAFDANGFGKYVKMVHSWGESIYAHLLTQEVQVGAYLTAGTLVGLSGNTGRSTGPHLHFGMRVNPFNRADGWGGYTDPAPYLNATLPPVNNGNVGVKDALRIAAKEFNVPLSLLAALAWNESSYQINAKSDKGAMGLMQIMPATWAEWSVGIGALDPYNSLDNARVGAAYLAWLLNQTKGNRYRAIVAYNWGIGNLMSDKAIPQSTATYAYKVLSGADLMEIWGI